MEFINDNFLLDTEAARELYHETASKLPIIDYHCHLSPKEIADDRKFKTLTNLWLDGDHYKWRAMRTDGVDERYCTGDASDRDKFQKWAETVPNTLRNPLYHWTHLELKKPFGVTELLNGESAERIYNNCNQQLTQDNFSCRGLIDQWNVEAICTTDDPIDSLEHHISIKKSGYRVKVNPTWRPDKAMAIESPTFNQYIDLLGKAADRNISTYSDLLDALKDRQQHFHDNGCRLSDHGLDTFIAVDYTDSEVSLIFSNAREGKAITALEIDKFRSAMLHQLGLMNSEKGWVQQFHIGAIRNNSTRLFNKLGPDTGFDSIGDKPVASSMSKYLNSLDIKGQLTKSILYNLNPSDNEVYATMIGNFQDGRSPGKMQWGSGWWFLDQKDGMEKQINALSNLGLLSRFVGMLTDSRSFLSYSRHEYFRRILCNILGNDIKQGLIPNDMPLLKKLVSDICYNNAKQYFKF